MRTLKQIAIYSRVSTKDKQDFERQVQELRNLVKQNEGEDVQITEFSEKVSGYKKSEDRPELNKLINILKENPKAFHCTYTLEISRIGRNPTETRQIIDDWSNRGVQLCIPKIGYMLEPNGNRNMIMNIILQVLMEYANQEAETFKIRSKSGLLKSARDGKAGGGKNLAYGYKKDYNKLLVINEDEADVIKTIFSLYKEGKGVKAISTILNQENVPTRANINFKGQKIKYNRRGDNIKTEVDADNIQWSDKTILDIIKNSIYKGQRKYKNIIIPIEPIISEELFDECNQIRLDKTHRNYTTTYTYLLKDKLICGVCGRNMFAKFKPVEGGDKVYICSSRLKSGGNCGNMGVNIALIESAIYDSIVVDNKFFEILDLTADDKKKIESNIKNLEQMIDSDKAIQKENEDKNTRLIYLFNTNKISETEFDKFRSEYQLKIENAIKRIKINEETLKESNSLLKVSTGIDAAKKQLLKLKKTRLGLSKLFEKFINKIILTKMDNDVVLSSLFYSVHGVMLPRPLNILLHIKGIRMKPIQYQYKVVNSDTVNPIYNRNILDVITRDKESLFNQLMWFKNVNGNDWNLISKKNIIEL
jgi:site-specific DNA recombinase